MCSIYTSFIFIVILNLSSSEVYVHLDTIGDCDKNQNLTMETKNPKLRMAPSGRHQYVDLDVIIKEDFKMNIRGTVDIDKCRSKESPDTCMHFTKMRTNKPYDIALSDTYGFKRVWACMSPPLEIPFKKGHYKARNCVLDFTLFNMFPILNSYWKVKGQLYYKNKRLACMTTYGSFYKT